MKNELAPRNSFRSDLKGIFIVLDKSKNPEIAYIREDQINKYLKYDRTTSEKGSMRIKFKFIG
jgi:hypothetical protein